MLEDLLTNETPTTWLFLRETVTSRLRHYHCKITESWVSPYPDFLSFGFPKGSPYRPFLNFELLRMMETGVLDLMRREHMVILNFLHTYGRFLHSCF